MKDIGIEYADLILIHFPNYLNGTDFSAEGRAEQWRALEYLRQMGKTRAIGVSHFCIKHVKDILSDPKL